MKRLSVSIALAVAMMISAASAGPAPSTHDGVTAGTARGKYSVEGTTFHLSSMPLTGSFTIAKKRFVGTVVTAPTSGAYDWRTLSASLNPFGFQGRAPLGAFISGVCSGLGGSAQAPGGGATAQPMRITLVCTGSVKGGTTGTVRIRIFTDRASDVPRTFIEDGTHRGFAGVYFAG